MERPLRQVSVIGFAVLLTARSGVSQDPTFQVPDFLPLSVGNSWTYRVYLGDFRYEEFRGGSEEVTISIIDTEVIDGHEYYLFDDPPRGIRLPPHFINGKRMRWEGNLLMIHDGSSEYALFRFPNPPGLSGDGSSTYGPTISYKLNPAKAKSDSMATVSVRARDKGVGVYFALFVFSGFHVPPRGKPARVYGFNGGSNRWIEFTGRYGVSRCAESIWPADYSTYTHEVDPITARLRSPATGAFYEIAYRQQAERGDFDIPTHDSASSWGRIKALVSREETVR